MSRAIIAIVVLMCSFVLLREVYFFPSLDPIPNPDNAWLIYAAKRLASGQKLYVDILETNPPLIVWLNLFPVYIGNFFGINPLVMLPILTTILALYNLYLCSKIIPKIFTKSEEQTAVIAYIAFGFFVLSTMVYGQREHLFIILVLPYLFSSLSSDRRPLSVIIIAAVGFAIKPFFLILWAFSELIMAVQRKKISGLFAFHNWFIGLFQLAYFTIIYLLTPEYYTTILPAIAATYFAFETSMGGVLEVILYIYIPVLIITILGQMKKYQNANEHFIPIVESWFYSTIFIILIQRKIWLNHQYPALFMAGFLLLICAFYLVSEAKKLKMDLGIPKFSALFAIFCLLIGTIFVEGKTSYLMTQKPTKTSYKLLAAIDKYANGKYIYPLVFNMQPSFPAIALSKGNFRGGFHHLWPVAGLIIRGTDNSFPLIENTRKWFYDKIIDDFTKFPPELVFVDENVNLTQIAIYDIKQEDRDIIGFLSKDERFAKIWQNYEKVSVIESELDEGEENKDKKPEKYSLYVRKKQ